jgi:signal transduction histidine kinase
VSTVDRRSRVVDTPRRAWASLGSALGPHRRRAPALERTRVTAEPETSAREAVLDERVRIARELHDVVAHHISIMGVHAGAARVTIGRDPVRAAQALASIEASSREAVAELHRLLGSLRQARDADDLASGPGLAQLRALTQTMRDAELAVEVRVEGDERPLPASVDASAYRTVQEALTNTLKHAGASRADVRLRYRRREFEVEIADDGRRRAAASTRGLGLTGMHERAAVHGGHLTAGPSPGGGFVVRLRLPTPDHPRRPSPSRARRPGR